MGLPLRRKSAMPYVVASILGTGKFGIVVGSAQEALAKIAELRDALHTHIRVNTLDGKPVTEDQLNSAVTHELRGDGPNQP
jgi:hypothetical protein